MFEQYAPLWALLTPEAAREGAQGNYERLFDAARRRVRAWERKNVKQPVASAAPVPRR